MKHAMVAATALLAFMALFPAPVTPDDVPLFPAPVSPDDLPYAAAPLCCQDSRPLYPGHTCGPQGTYDPGSAYEASLKLLAATVPAKANAEIADSYNRSSFVENAGYSSDDTIVASTFCQWHQQGANTSDCGACLALAFTEAQRLCPYQRQADVVVDGGACSLHYHDYELMEQYVHGLDPDPASVSSNTTGQLQSPGHTCDSWQLGRYAPFSAYETNLRRLAATVVAEFNASTCNCSVGRVAGDLPDQVAMSAYCHWSPNATSSDCSACVALAFREARWRCPYHRQAATVVDGGACSIRFHDVFRTEQYMRGQSLTTEGFHTNRWPFGWHVVDTEMLLIILFQVIGLAFVVFLFLQVSPARNQGRAGSDDYIPVPGDERGLEA